MVISLLSLMIEYYEVCWFRSCWVDWYHCRMSIRIVLLLVFETLGLGRTSLRQEGNEAKGCVSDI